MNNTLFLKNEVFIKWKDDKLSKVKLIVKSVKILILKNTLIFNKCKFFKDRNNVILIQKN